MEVTRQMISELIELTKELTGIPAPSHNEGQRVAYLKNYLKKNGYEEVIEDDAGNLIVEVGNVKDATQRNLYLYTAHTDTVFPEMTPIPVEEKGGYLYGPGVGDDTANVAAMAVALKYIRSHGYQPSRPIAYVFDSCEEGLGNLKGMWAAYHRYKNCLGRHVAFDGSTDHIVNRAVGSSRYEITVTTQGGHSFNCYGNRNAIAVAAGMIAALYHINTAEFSGKTTYNVGKIEGGTSVNTIAQAASFCYEYRSDEQENIQAMKEKSQVCLAMALGVETFLLEDGYEISINEEAKEKKATICVKELGTRPGMGQVDENKQQALTEHIAAKLEKYTGSRPSCDSGSTDCNIPLSNGITAACFGVYLGAGQHTREEYIRLDSLEAGMKTILELMQEDYQH